MGAGRWAAREGAHVAGEHFPQNESEGEDVGPVAQVHALCASGLRAVALRIAIRAERLGRAPGLRALVLRAGLEGARQVVLERDRHAEIAQLDATQVAREQNVGRFDVAVHQPVAAVQVGEAGGDRVRNLRRLRSAEHLARSRLPRGAHAPAVRLHTLLNQLIQRDLAVLKREAEVAVGGPLGGAEAHDVLVAHRCEHARLVLQSALDAPALANLHRDRTHPHRQP